MSCEDDQSECMELFHTIKDKNVLVSDEISAISELFVDFGEAYECDDDDVIDAVLDEIAWTLKEAINKHNLTDIKLGWFVASR